MNWNEKINEIFGDSKLFRFDLMRFEKGFLCTLWFDKMNRKEAWGLTPEGAIHNAINGILEGPFKKEEKKKVKMSTFEQIMRGMV